MSESPFENTNIPLGSESDPAPQPHRAAVCPWTLGDFFLFFLLTFCIAVLFSVVFGFGLGVFSEMRDEPLDIKKTFKNPFVILGYQVFLLGVVFVVLYLLTVVRRRSPFWPALKLHRTPTKWLQIGTLGGVLLAVVVQFIPPIFEGQDPFPFKEFFSSPASAYALSLFAVTVAPFMEELVFRGFMFRIFESQFGITGAVVSTAILFWAIHAPQYWNSWNHLLLISIVALALSGLRAWAGSLLPCIVMHTVYNFVLVLFFYEATDRFRKLPALIG